MNPDTIFEDLKSKVKHITYKDLQQIFDFSLQLASKFKATGQIRALQKLLFVMDSIEKERHLIQFGIDRYIYKDEIDFYIDNFSAEHKPIKIIELENYSREVPDEIAEAVEKTKDIFDQFYILYTDYSDLDGKRVEAEKRSTDPILFGVFINQQKRVCVDRFYVLGDWIDPYCDLTLEAFVTNMAQKGRDANHSIYQPESVDELRAYLDQAKLKNDNTNIEFSFPPTATKRQSWFDKVKSWFK